MSVRVRFAPSPTGQVHIGNMRAAIFNWLYARHHGGQFLLRIEDTDRERSTPEAIQSVLDAMVWLGMDFDEDPMYQSARADAHLAAAEALLASGHAYRDNVGGKGECVVLRMPQGPVRFQDELKGELVKDGADMKDLVIVRSDGSPVFHLANVVDDIEMGITHVIRGDDHIENTYRHIALYEALGAEVPRFAHLPMIVNAQGKPYSKRDGAAFVGEFRDEYLGDALFNFLALLGWSPGDDREVMTREDMIAAFDLSKVKSSAAQMDMRKFDWLNGQHIRLLPYDEYRARFVEALAAGDVDVAQADDALIDQVAGLMHERTTRFSELPELCAHFFSETYAYDEKTVKKRLLKEGAMDHLAAVGNVFAEVSIWDGETMDAAIEGVAEVRETKSGQLFPLVRLAVSGLGRGPDFHAMLEILGQERVVSRIEATLERFRGEAWVIPESVWLRLWVVRT